MEQEAGCASSRGAVGMSRLRTFGQTLGSIGRTIGATMYQAKGFRSGSASWHGALLFCKFVLLVSVIAGPIAIGREETVASEREIPDPSLCQVAPRPLAFFAELAGVAATPGGAASAATVTTTLTPPTQGQVDEPTAEAIRATIRELVACRNANDLLRSNALYSDAFFYRQLAVSGAPNLDFLEARATPVPLDEAEWAAIKEIRGVRFLPDGRVSAMVDLQFPGEAATFIFTFVPAGDRWVVDSEKVFNSSQTSG